MQQKIISARAWLTKHERPVFWAIFALLTLALAFLCFYKLGGYMLNPWDESFYGINAYEMTQTHNYILTTRQYVPDYDNMKPPFTTWMIALCYRVFGYNAFALRLPSALAMLAIGVVGCLWLRRRAGNLAALSSLALFLTCEPFFNYHMARHGDTDAVYCLLFLLAMICMMELQNHPRLLYVCGILFAFSFLTKSWHAAAIVAVGFLYLVFSGYLRHCPPLRLAGFAACCLVPVGIWAVLRYLQDGWVFLKLMVTYDIIDRLNGTYLAVENNPLDYITDYSRYPEFLGYLLLAGAALALYLFARRKGKTDLAHSQLALGLFLWAVVPFVMFSAMSAKKIWYVFPSVMALIFAAGCGIQLLANTGLGKTVVSLKTLAAALAVVLIAAIPLETGCKETLKTVLRAGNDNGIQLLFAQSLVRDVPQLSKHHIYQKDRDVPEWRELSDQLAAELYGDLAPIGGGIEAFVAEPGSYLIVDGETYAATPELSSAQVYAEGEGYYLLYHQE